jgi:hypothetical protein
VLASAVVAVGLAPLEYVTLEPTELEPGAGNAAILGSLVAIFPFWRTEFGKFVAGLA